MSVGEGQWAKGCWGTGKGQEQGGEGEDRKEGGWEERWQWGGGDWEGGMGTERWGGGQWGGGKRGMGEGRGNREGGERGKIREDFTDGYDGMPGWTWNAWVEWGCRVFWLMDTLFTRATPGTPSWSIKVSIAAQKFATSTLMSAPLKVMTIECIEHDLTCLNESVFIKTMNHLLTNCSQSTVLAMICRLSLLVLNTR